MNRKIVAITVLSIPGFVLGQEKCGDSLEPVNLISPKYPAVEMYQPHNASVLLEFVLTEDGNVNEAIAFRASSEPTDRYISAFKESALAAIESSTFKAKYYPCRAQYRYVFQHEGKDT